MRRASCLALFFSNSLALAVAQAPLGSPAAIRLDVAGADPIEGSPAYTRLEVGERALAAGRSADALRDFLAALELHPASPAVLRAMLRAVVDDADARAVFGLWLALATLDEKGRPKPAREDKDLLLPKDAAPSRLAAAQFAAFDELARELARLETGGRNALGNGLVARWLADLAIELGREMPHVLAARAVEIDGVLARHGAEHGTVFAALQKAFELRGGATAAKDGGAAASRDAIDRAMRAARIALGLVAQAGFGKDLYGPKPPELGTLSRDAHEAIDALRREVDTLGGEPWTIARLEALDPVARSEFTAAHSTWADPGIALSPNGRYRIETVCGFETLLGAAKTVESHHARLVAWYGTDPFTSRPGLVRIEPEHGGLESNGAPFWWAGGFQSGDITTLRFAWGSIPGLGRGLTHELTHRFDGTLVPFLPSWAVEGRAVWTGASYGRITDPAFAEDFLAPYTIQTPFVKGYGGVENLTRLLAGTIDDYRDNYTAGYALFAYLRSWRGEDGKPLFAARLEKYFRYARGGRSEPVAYFVEHFADGKEGRPEGLPAFADGFREFLHQCYRWCWNDRDAANAWLSRYRMGLEGDKGYGMVMDAPSLGWSRDRAEPWFGQGHADEAARLFEQLGDPRAASAAACWSLLVDGPDLERFDRASRMLDAAQRKDAAWVARLEGALRFASLPIPADAPPIAPRLAKTRRLLELLREAAVEHRAAGRPLAAATFDERCDRVAFRLGSPLTAPKAPVESASQLPRIEPPHVLGAFGWVEDGLTGYEERRVPNLWFETPHGDLHVGREKPRDETGLTDRAAHQRHAFTRSAEWLGPGRYVVRLRIHFTTSFVSGAVVVGYTRRDRNLRVHFSAGDFLYSIGRKDDDGKTKAVDLSLDGTFERENHLVNPMRATKVEFELPSSYVDLELHIDGPTLDVWAMGRHRLRHTTTDLAPIEGAIGFAMGQGAVRVQAPTVQRLDRGALTPPTTEASTFTDLLHRPLPGVPLAPSGTLVLWLPRSDDQDWLAMHATHWLRTLSKAMRDVLAHPQPWVLMVQSGLSPEALAKVQAAAREAYGKELEVVTDPRAAAPEEEVHVLFVDARGALRAAGSGGEMAMPDSVAQWARRSRPPRRE